MPIYRRRYERIIGRVQAWALLAVSFAFASSIGLGADAKPGSVSDLHGPDTARVVHFPLPLRPKTERAGYLGVRVDLNEAGKLVVAAIAPDSPASIAGFELRDQIEEVENQPVSSPEAFARTLEAKSPGSDISIAIRRGGSPLRLKANLQSQASIGRPTTRQAPAVTLGVRTGETRPEGGERIAAIDPDSSALRAGLHIGDFILKINQTALTASTHLIDALAGRKPNETVTVLLLRDGQEIEVRAPLTADKPRDASGRARGFGTGNRAFTAFKKDVFRIAVIGVEFADVKHNPKIQLDEWQKAFFSKKAYIDRNATGQNVYGSVNDFYQEDSAGAMRVEGTVFDWVQVSKKRLDYYTPAMENRGFGATTQPRRGGRGGRGTPAGGNRASRGGAAVYDTELLNDVMEQLTQRAGPDVLNGYDGLILLYAGSRPVRTNGNVFWPHTSGMVYRGQRIMYCIAEEGGQRMTNISLFCHEIGHMLGLPDLYVQREPGSPPSMDAVGLGNWCLMSIQVSNGRPQHMSAWCKERLGWIKPAIIDPAVRQHLVLAPIENSSKECFKIPLKPDGTEYLLLENRRRIGFDISVPGEGLVIWHVANGRPILVEAHGLTGPRAPTFNVQNIPFPTSRNDRFTPYSKPSSVIESDDAYPVYITNIRRQPEGRVSFDVGFGFD